MALRASRRGIWAVALLLAGGTAAAAGASALKQKADRLAREARALAKTSGCEKVEECAVAGFGHKPCGGPREFIAYCTRTTDEEALQSRLDALEQAEKEWQAAEGVMSNCGLTRRPKPRLVDGECRAR